MNIAIVILNWNGRKLLEQFLPSVIQNSNEAKIYLVDNASTDDSIAFVKNNYPEIYIIKNSENGGYAKGYNNALHQINADIFCLLNNDVEVSPNWINPIIQLFKSDPSTAIIQPKLLDFKNKNYFEYAGAAGGFIDKYGYPYCRGRIFSSLEEDIGQYDDESEVFWASGACFFIRKDLFHQLGGFDESFFAHMEEIDLCWRAINLGYKVKYCFKSQVHHLGGATLNDKNPKKTFLNFRNSLFTLTKNAKGDVFQILIVRLILDGIAGITFLFQLKPKHTFAIVKAHLHFYANLPYVLNLRKLQTNKANYYKINSIIFEYYIKRKKNYKSL